MKKKMKQKMKKKNEMKYGRIPPVEEQERWFEWFWLLVMKFSLLCIYAFSAFFLSLSIFFSTTHSNC